MDMLSALFFESDLRVVFANGYEMLDSARGPLQSYQNETNMEEIHQKKKKEKEKVMVNKNMFLILKRQKALFVEPTEYVPEFLHMPFKMNI